MIHLTVAAEGGRRLPPDDPLYSQLLHAIQSAGAPAREVKVDSFVPVQFRLVARVRIDPAYLSAQVLAECRKRLAGTYDFDHATFGQVVDGSQILNIIQQVDGVVSVDLDVLERVLDQAGDDDALNPTELTLRARLARYDPERRQIDPADLLLLDPDTGIVLHGESS